jgi:hypothetical protein
MKSKFLFLVFIVLVCNTSISAQNTDEVDTFYIYAGITPSEMGTLTPNGVVSVPKDSSITFTFVPINFSLVWGFIIDGMPTSLNSYYSYTFENVQSNHTFQVCYIPKVEESTVNKLVQITPNPAQTEIHLKTDLTLLSDNQCEIYNNLGIKVKDYILSDNESTIDLSDLPNGLYFVVLHSKEGIMPKRLIKQ